MVERIVGGVISKAPMSLTPKRATPRWSVGKLAALLPASIAGLFCSSAMVNVGPPLSANGASKAGCPRMFPVELPLTVQPAVLKIRL